MIRTVYHWGWKRPLNQLSHNQCDQMRKLFFNICPFIKMEICPKAKQFPQRWLNFFPNTNLSIVKLPKDF